jgi:hypothetical protein
MRVEIPEVIWQATTISGQSALAPKSAAAVEVRLRNAADTTGVSVMDAETAGAALPNPLTSDSLGRVFGWLEEGSYDFIVDGDTANKFRFEAVRGQRNDIILGSDVSLTRVAANVLGLGANDTLAIPGSEVTSLPGSPQDGQIVAYKADATAGVIWLFRYRAGSASAHKWEFIGGSPLYALVDTDELLTNAAYVNLPTVGPSVTAPLAGEYQVRHGCLLYQTAAAVQSTFMSYAVGATAAVDADSIQLQPSALNEVEHMSRDTRKTGVLAADAFVAKYKVNAGATSHFARRHIMITPIRCS